jgi:hypothetical protein
LALSESIIEKIVAGETDPKQIRELALDNVFLRKWLGKALKRLRAGNSDLTRSSVK